MDREKLTADLVRDEGLRLKVYTDSVGIPTIGVGRNLRDVGISREEAFRMLGNDIERVEVQLDQQLPWWRELDEPRQRVIANMAFNLGVPGLMKFRDALAHVQAGRYAEAASAMLASTWARQVGPRAVRLADTMERG